MAKKKSKNLQKLLKKQQLQQLHDNQSAEVVNQPEVIVTSPVSQAPVTPKSDHRPIIKTIISTAIIIALLIGVSVSASSQDYLNKFGDWLYQTLELDS